MQTEFEFLENLIRNYNLQFKQAYKIKYVEETLGNFIILFTEEVEEIVKFGPLNGSKELLAKAFIQHFFNTTMKMLKGKEQIENQNLN